MTNDRPLDHGLTVAEAARVLGCDQDTVRSLVRNGQLEGWRVGKGDKGKMLRSIRVSHGSCLEYRQRNSAAEAPVSKPPPTTPRRRRLHPGYEEAIRSLRAMGVRI